MARDLAFFLLLGLLTLVAAPALAQEPLTKAPTAGIETQRSLDDALLDAVRQGHATDAARALTDGANPYVRLARQVRKRRFLSRRYKWVTRHYVAWDIAVDRARDRSKGGLSTLTALLNAGADPNHNAGGRPPLRSAVSAKDLEVTALLLAAGADPTLARDALNSASAEMSDAELRGFVEQFARVRSLDELLCDAAFGDAAALAREVLDQGASVEVTCGVRPVLHVAASQGLETAAVLLDAGADPHALAADGSTALHAAVRVASLDNALIQRLLDAGVDPTVVNAKGETAFHVALIQHVVRLHSLPETPRLRAARLSAWLLDPVRGDDAVSQWPEVQQWGVTRLERVHADLGTARFIALFSHPERDRIAAALTGPGGEARRALKPECTVGPRTTLGAATRLLGEREVGVRNGPVLEATFASGAAAGFLRPGLVGPRRLRWVRLSHDCDVLGGTLLGLPSDAAVAVLGRPEVVLPGVLGWTWDGAEAVEERAAVLTVYVYDGVIEGSGLDWRRH